MAEERYETVVLDEEHTNEPEVEVINEHSNVGKIALVSLGALGALGLGATILCRKKLRKLKHKRAIKKLEKEGFTVTSNNVDVTDESEEIDPEE